MKRFSARGRTATGWQYEHQHHICLNLYEVSLASLLKRDRIKDFFRFPVSGLFDGSMKL
jgi:hypothetical protein